MMMMLRILSIVALFCAVPAAAEHWHFAHRHFVNDMNVPWGKSHVNVSHDGRVVQLALDEVSGAQIKSRDEFLFLRTSVMLKLIPGDSAGTITAFYLSSYWDDPDGHDEMDLEFLGNSTGEPYALHTNIYVRGFGEREQRFFLWFDPTEDFHNYTILWNIHHIVLFVDGIPIRAYRNYEDSYNSERAKVLYPRQKPMRVIQSIWNCDQWATQGGNVKINWTSAPFVATFANLTVNGCPREYNSTLGSIFDCWDAVSPLSWWNAFHTQLSYAQRSQLEWVRSKYMIYDYCQDLPRFNFSPPIECTLPHY